MAREPTAASSQPKGCAPTPRVRLTATSEGRIAALARPSNAPRVDAQALKGNLGDPWVPINRGKGDSSSLTVSGNGFDYRIAQRILFNNRELKRPLALKQLPGEKNRDTEIHMAVLVRGQGKTEGLHERVIPLPQSIAAHLSFDADEDDDKDCDGPFVRQALSGHGPSGQRATE